MHRPAFVFLVLAAALFAPDARAALTRNLDCPSPRDDVPARATAICASLERHQKWERRWGGHDFFSIGFTTTQATVDAVVGELGLTDADAPALRCLYDFGIARNAVRVSSGAHKLLKRVGAGAPDAATSPCEGPLAP